MDLLVKYDKIDAFKALYKGEDMIDLAVSCGSIRIVQFLLDQKCQYPVYIGVSSVCSENLDMVKLIHQKIPHSFDICSIREACIMGNIEILEFLMDKGVEFDEYSLKQAVINRHLHIVKFLHKRDVTGFKDMIDVASKAGHLDIVEFLCENRTEGFTDYALYISKRYDYDEIYEYLKINDHLLREGDSDA